MISHDPGEIRCEFLVLRNSSDSTAYAVLWQQATRDSLLALFSSIGTTGATGKHTRHECGYYYAAPDIVAK